MFNKRLALVLAVGVLAISPAVQGQKARRAAKPDLAETTRLIVKKTNEFRKEQDRADVTVNAKLTAAAEYFADYLARTGKFSHTADDTEPWDRARKHGYQDCIVTENIAYQYNSTGFKTEKLAEEFVQGWKDSPGHRKNILDRDVTETGVAVARSADTGYYYAVQMFGRPKSQAIKFAISNDANRTVDYQVGDQSFTLPPLYTRTHRNCRPADLAVELPGPKVNSKGETKTVRPTNGDRFVIRKVRGVFVMDKQK